MKSAFVLLGFATVIASFTQTWGGEPIASYGGKEITGKNVVADVPVDYYAQANNPLAEVTSFEVQNYYLFDIETLNDDANQLLLRYSQPFELAGSDWLFRANLPINEFPDFAGGTETGLGDLTLHTAYLFDTRSPDVSFGIGPVLRAPTASDIALGTDVWAGGVAASYFNGINPRFQFGFTAAWQQGFENPSARPHFHVGAVQPFAFYQLGDGWYTGMAPVWIYDFQSDSYNIPLGLRLGKVLVNDNTVFNAYVEPQYSVANRGIYSDWQILAGIKIQFW